MNYKSLSKVLRYSVTHEDFERQIDADPSDWQNHLVYADWLQEHNHPDQHFRRAMGEWWREKGHLLEQNPQSLVIPYLNSTHPFGQLSHILVQDEDQYPEGVNPRRFLWQHPNDYGHVIGPVFRFDTLHPTNFTEGHRHSATNEAPNGTMYHGYLNRFGWNKYRDMENAFRRAYNEGKTEHEIPVKVK